jgi:hypothetical protein
MLITDLNRNDEIATSRMSAVRGGVRTTGVDEVGLLTENRQPNNKPPTGGRVQGVSAVQPVTITTLSNEMFGSIALF